MAKINNATAQKKWDSLKGSAGVSLKKIVQGTATSADYQRMMNLLNQQSSLASKVFSLLLETATINAEKNQKDFEAVLDKNNKVILSAFEVALNAEMKKLEPDLVGKLKDIVEMAVLQSNEDLDHRMGNRFDAIKELLPEKRDNPSVNDLLAANDLLAEKIEADSEAAWVKRENSLIEKIANIFEGTLRNLAQRINEENARRQQGNKEHGRPESSVPRLVGPLPSGSNEGRQTVLARGLSLIHGGTIEGGISEVKSPTSGVTGEGSATTAVVALSPAAQHDLMTAADAQKGFYNRVKALLPSPTERNDGEAQKQDDESKKADTWWRSFKNWFGNDQEKRKSSKSDKFGWLKGLGQMLALMILNPQLFKTLGDAMKDLLTWDNLKGAAEKSWDWVKGMSSSVMEVISNMLGGTMKSPTQTDITNAKQGKKDLATTPTKAGDTTHANLKNLTPEQQKQFDAFGKANKENSETGPGFLNSVFSMFGITTPAMRDYNNARTDTNPNSKTYGHIIINGQDKGPNPDFKPQTTVAPTNRSSIVDKAPLPPTMPTGAAASTTFTETPPIPMTPGIALPEVDASHVNVGSGATQPQRGAQQIGMGSFGFHAANSDSLILMNTTHFTAG